MLVTCLVTNNIREVTLLKTPARLFNELLGLYKIDPSRIDVHIVYFVLRTRVQRAACAWWFLIFIIRLLQYDNVFG